MLRGKAPVDPSTRRVAALLPGLDLGCQGREVRDVSVESLAAEHGASVLRDAQPAATLARVLDFNLVRQPL